MSLRWRNLRVLVTSVALGAALCSSGFGGSGFALAATAGPERFAIVPASSTATYQVAETFIVHYLDHIVVGTTHAIQGQIVIDPAHPDASMIGPITVDLRTLKTDAPNRDAALQRQYIESAKYPTAVFTSTAIYGVPDVYVDGRDVQVEVLGSLTMHGATKPERFTGTVRLTGNMLTGTLSSKVPWTDFSIASPTILGQRVISDDVTLTVQFVAARQ